MVVLIAGIVVLSTVRVNHMGFPLFLANQDWEIIGTVEIVEYTQKLGETSGRYRVLDLFDQDLRQLMTKKFAKKKT
jgi:hypothetical protein